MSGFHVGCGLRASASMVSCRRRDKHVLWALNDDGHQSPHPPALPFGLNVVAADRVRRTTGIESLRRAQALCRSPRSVGGVPTFDGEAVAVALYDRLHIGLFAFLAGEDEGRGQWHIHMRKRRVRALYRARPEPGDDGELLADERLEVGPFLRHLRGDLDRRIEWPMRFWASSRIQLP